MLQRIRDRLTGGFAIAILALLALPFLFFGINYNFIGSSYAAKVNGEEIAMFEFDNAYRQQLAQYGEFAGQLPENLRQMLKQNVLDGLIYDELVDQHVAESNYRITDEMVTEAIRSVPEFRVDGRFSKDAYYGFLAERGLDPQVFEANQRLRLREAQLQRGIGATAFVTPAEYRRYLNLVREQRDVSIATFDIESVAETIEVSDQEVLDYYDERSEEFTSPETVDFRYVELNRGDLADRVELTEEEVREYYESVSSRYLQDERRRASHILIPFGDDRNASEEQARALAERVRAGEPFADLARQHSADGLTAEQGGDLGLLAQSQYLEGLGDAVYSMREGEIVGPVESEYGFHVVRLEEIQPGGPRPLEEVRAEVVRELRSEKALSLWQAKEEALGDALFDAEDIGTVAAAADLPVEQATGFTRNGGEPFGSNQAAIDAVFDEAVLEDRRISDIVELDANRSVVLQVTEYNEPAPLPLEEVRDEIVTRLKNDEARAIVLRRSSELQAAVRDGTAFEAAAAEAGASEVTTTSIRRDSTDVDGNVRAAVFAMKKPQPGSPKVDTVQTTTGDQAVFALTGWEPGRPEAMPVAQRDEGKLRLAGQAGQQDYVSLVLDLERRADVVRNEDAISRESLFE